MKYWRGYLTAFVFAVITWALIQFGQQFTSLVDMVYPYVIRTLQGGNAVGNQNGGLAGTCACFYEEVGISFVYNFLPGNGILLHQLLSVHSDSSFSSLYRPQIPAKVQYLQASLLSATGNCPVVSAFLNIANLASSFSFIESSYRQGMVIPSRR